MNYIKPTEQFVCQLEEKRSRFIAYLFVAKDEKTFKEQLTSIRKEHPKANHHCWAAITGMPSNPRCWNQSDDGEPKGTAGKPILKVLDYAGIGECGLVVVRYFGGIKLGTGGLVRAYTTAAQKVLEIATTEPLVETLSVCITTDYASLKPINLWLNRNQIIPSDQQFTDSITILLDLTQQQVDELRDIIKDLRYTKLVLGNDV
jgi:uncharacterized YigZ family protein